MHRCGLQNMKASLRTAGPSPELTAFSSGTARASASLSPGQGSTAAEAFHSVMETHSVTGEDDGGSDAASSGRNSAQEEISPQAAKPQVPLLHSAAHHSVAHHQMSSPVTRRQHQNNESALAGAGSRPEQRPAPALEQRSAAEQTTTDQSAEPQAEQQHPQNDSDVTPDSPQSMRLVPVNLTMAWNSLGLISSGSTHAVTSGAPGLLPNFTSVAPSASSLERTPNTENGTANPRAPGLAAPKTASGPALAAQPVVQDSTGTVIPGLLTLTSGLDSEDAPAPASSQPAGESSPPNSNGAAASPASEDLRLEAANAGAPPAPDTIAFEAKLSMVPASTSPAGNAALQVQPPVEQSPATRQASAWSSSETDASLPTASSAKIEAEFLAPLAPAPVLASAHYRPEPANSGASTEAPVATRMQTVIDQPPGPQATPHSITVRVPGTATDSGIDLRFVDRGGNVHLLVRTPNPEVAQELRGGLNDLVSRLQHAGIRAEVSTPHASDAAAASQSKSQSDSHDPSADRRGSGRNQSESRNQQRNPQNSNQSRWMEAVEQISSGPSQSHQLSKEQNV